MKTKVTLATLWYSTLTYAQYFISKYESTTDKNTSTLWHYKNKIPIYYKIKTHDTAALKGDVFCLTLKERWWRNKGQADTLRAYVVI